MAPQPMASPTAGARLLAEFLGTFVLTFTVGCNVLLKTPVWGGMSVACGLMVVVQGLAGISGAHFNPAVSLASAVNRALGGHGLIPLQALKYSLVQMVAGIAAAWCASMMCHKNFDLAPSPGFGLWQAGLCEFLYAFMLCLVVLCMHLAAAAGPTDAFGVAIGFVMVAGIYGAGPISGGFFNPAISLGIDVAGYASGFGWCLAYLVFQLLGGVAAAFLFKVVRNEETGGLRRGLVPELTSEFVGTYVLVLTLGLNVLAKSPAEALSVGAALACMTYAFSGVSGANFNPAVTLAVLVSSRSPRGTARKTGGQACMAMGVQLLAGILGAMTYSAVYLGGSFRLGPGSHLANWDAVVAVEFVFTFLLCYVFLCTTLSEATASPPMHGLAIGLCATLGMVAAKFFAAGALNPAISVGVVAAHRFGDSGLFAAGAFSVTQLFAGVVAASVFKATHKVDMETKVEY